MRDPSDSARRRVGDPAAAGTVTPRARDGASDGHPAHGVLHSIVHSSLPLSHTDADVAAQWRADVYARATAGETAAYAELLRVFRPRFLRYATRMLRDRDAAEDAAQESFVRAFRSIGQCAGPEQLDSWMFSILANRCRSALEKRARRERLFARFRAREADDEAIDPAIPALDATTQHVTRALESLSPEQREAFVMRHVEELGYDEMARVTGASVSALKMRVSRARELLRRELLRSDELRGRPMEGFDR